MQVPSNKSRGLPEFCLTYEICHFKKITQKRMLMNITRLYYAGVITRCNIINIKCIYVFWLAKGQCSGAASPQWLPHPFQFHTPSRLLPASGGVRQSPGNFGSGVVMGISIKGLCRYLSFSLSLV